MIPDITTRQQLLDYLATFENAPTDYKIAIGSLVFTPDDKVILLERGKKARDAAGKLEGIGGGLDEGEDNLHDALRREIKEEVDIEVSIEKVLTVAILPGENYPWWVVIIYLCKIQNGTPKIMEPEKCNAIHTLKLEDVDSEKLSFFQKAAMDAYAKQYGTKPYYK